LCILKKDNVIVKAPGNSDSDDDSDDTDEDDDNEQPAFSTKQILAVFNCYEDIPKDANAYRVVAILLENCGHHSPALTYGLRALKICADPVLRFRILNLLTIIYLHKKQNTVAYETICEGFSNLPSLPPKVHRAGLITRAKAEVAVGKKDEAVISYEEARLADPEEPLQGFNLKYAFNACLAKKDDAMLVELVKNWKPMERLAWMTWNLDEDGYNDHEVLRRAAARAGQQEYLYQAYDEVIKLLDNVDAAAPIRFHLAVTHWEVALDTEAAKTLLNETLDTSSSGDPFALTNEDPAYTLVCAVLFMSEIIYQQYRTTSDSSVKAQLYTEIKGLTKRPLAQSIASLKSELTHHSLTIARMARKMAPAREFQDILENAFNVCYEALIDNVGWNDFLNLNELAAVISTLDGLEKEAQILISAQFSKLDPSIKDDSDSDSDDEGEKPNGVESEAGDKKEDEDEESDSEEDDDDDNDDSDDNDDYPLPTDEGDLADVDVECSGECIPVKKWRAWKGRTLYFCTICCNTSLCEDCYNKRQGYNRAGGDEACRASVGSVYCGTNHRYITPIKGWKGIKDGVMTIQGQDGEETISVKFRDWLEELKTVKWKQAWERFWLKED
jgi:tetratricopeptide (TPR) repeat protein